MHIRITHVYIEIYTSMCIYVYIYTCIYIYIYVYVLHMYVHEHMYSVIFVLSIVRLLFGRVLIDEFV